MNTEQLILSIGVILLAARTLGWIFQRIGQPRVIGEMTAGIALGPSLLGRIFPAGSAYLFPPASISALTVLSQLGLLLFMFVVGLEVDLQRALKQRPAVVLISNFSIVLPLLLGMGLATVLYPQFAGPHVGFSSFALFMGTAMSITASPVLARILKERNLLGTSLETMAISCAAIDDISAWLLLAVLTAMVHSAQSWHRLAITLLLLVVLVAAMLGPIRRTGSFFESVCQKHGGVLMNTRGLVELVILNAGLDLGILSPPLFTMMVIMALVTTFMTTPILIAMKIQPSSELHGPMTS